MALAVRPKWTWDRAEGGLEHRRRGPFGGPSIMLGGVRVQIGLMEASGKQGFDIPYGSPRCFFQAALYVTFDTCKVPYCVTCTIFSLCNVRQSRSATSRTTVICCESTLCSIWLQDRTAGICHTLCQHIFHLSSFKRSSVQKMCQETPHSQHTYAVFTVPAPPTVSKER